MDKKSQKGLFIIIGILVVLVLLLIVLSGALLLRGVGQEKKSGSRESGKTMTGQDSKQDDGETGDIFLDEIQTDEESEGEGISIVIRGVQLKIPSDYSCFYDEDIGPVVYLDDVFQMKTVVNKGSYKDIMKDPDAITEKMVAAGGEILQDAKETEINGKKYLYFLADLYDEKCLLVHTQAGDTDKRLAGQLVMESDTLTEEDLLNVFASIAESAEATDASDSTMEDINRQEIEASQDWGKKKEQSKLSYAGATATFQVPEGFYSQGEYTSDLYGQESFATKEYKVEAECFLWNTADYENAETYVSAMLENEAEWGEKWSGKKIKLQTEEVEGRTCYFIMTHYSYDGSDFQRIHAACEVDDSHFFVVEVSAIDYEKEISFDTIQEFFVLQ